MVKKIYEFFLEHGLTVMLIGFIVALGGLLVYLNTKYWGNYVPQLAFGVTIAGFVIYIVGRIAVSAQRRRKKTSIGKNANID